EQGQRLRQARFGHRGRKIRNVGDVGELLHARVDFFKQASPDFQDVHGYESSKYQTDALKLASKYIGNEYKCLSLTLEMPFKDNANLPDESVGWNGARSAALGASMLQAILWHLQAFGA
ncbi:hypothetical protein QCE49_08060, partial [Caballeronia sp. LZ008]|nr:hypothetical protein [Caballeronia sp. LZ008]